MTLKSLLLALILVLLSFQYSALAEKKEKEGVSRRSFLQRAAAAVTAVVAVPSLPFSAGATAKGLPITLRKKLASLRLSTLGTSDSGLKIYISQLKELTHPGTPDVLKKYINVRINSAEQALEGFDAMKAEQLAFKTKTKSLGAKISKKNALKSASKNSRPGLKKINLNKIEALGDLNAMPPDIRMLTIRTLLDVNLMSRMAWQAHYGDKTVTLTKNEVQLIQEYKHLLNLTLKSAPKKSLSSVLIPKLVQEADFVLEAYRSTSRLKKTNIISCSKIL